MAAQASTGKKLTIAMVAVSDPGNAPDPATGFGAVASAFQIARNDITIGQYTAFLNAVARTSDPAGLYNPMMATDFTVAGISRTKKSGKYTYAAIAPQGAVQVAAATATARPITYVSWFDSARFANWMANGHPSGNEDSTTTERGAYDLTSKSAKDGKAVPVSSKNPNTGKAPSYFLPTENQWYKAAYFNKNLNAGAGGYFVYANQSTTPPTNALTDTPNQANYTWAGKVTTTQVSAMDVSQNYLTNVGAFTGTAGPFGTFDMNGNVWEWTDADGVASPLRSLRGGAWTSYYTYLQSTFRIGSPASSQSSNGGMRVASSLTPAQSPFYALVSVGNAGNAADVTGYGKVADAYSIGKYEVTISQYSRFLNAVAKTDAYGLFDPNMTSGKNAAGIARTGTAGSYTYAPIDNAGDSANRPIAFVSWFDSARFANWLANGMPEGAQSATTTENGAYALNGAINGAAPARNATNPNTGAAPTFFMPSENQWYKAAFFSSKLNKGAGGYYLYATQSNSAPSNHIGSAANQVNYINDADGSNTYAVTQKVSIDVSQNYLTNAGFYTATPSYYGALDMGGLVYNWNDLDGKTNAVRGMRGGFWFSGPPSIQSLTFNQAGASREANDTGIRLAAR